MLDGSDLRVFRSDIQQEQIEQGNKQTHQERDANITISACSDSKRYPLLNH